MFRKDIERQQIAARPWGEAFLREFDLVIAANEIESLKTRQTLYNDALALQVSLRCSPLDGDVKFKQLETVVVPPNTEEPYRRLPDALASLSTQPRGHWAVFEMDGKYDAYMADGYGGVGTESGYKFTYVSAKAPRLNPDLLYGQVLAMMVYLRRNQIGNEIMEHTFHEQKLQPEQKFKLPGFTSDRFIRFEEVIKGYYSGGSDAVKFVETGRGRRAKTKVCSCEHFARMVGMEPVMPPQYVDLGNEARIISEFLAKWEVAKENPPQPVVYL